MVNAKVLIMMPRLILSALLLCVHLIKSRLIAMVRKYGSNGRFMSTSSGFQ